MSIGIIGGADGPTTILVSAVQSTALITPWQLVLLAVGAALLGYLLGSLEFGIIVCKLLYHQDIRDFGSGNAGTTNVLRTFGKKAAALALLGDMGKGMVSVLLARIAVESLFYTAYPGGVDIGAIAAFAAVIGHLKPLYFGFKGGKGVAVAAGTILATNPMLLLALAVVFVTLFAITRIVSLTSITCAALYPVFTCVYCLMMHQNVMFNTLCAAAMGGLVIYMHRSNIQRLREGTEYKFGQKK